MIKFLVMDVDGTLTDGKIYMGVDGEAFKAFDIKDGYALHTLLKEHGIIPVIITARKSPMVEHRCKELGVTEIHQGVMKKLDCLKSILEKYSSADQQYDLSNVAYIGDDLLDLQCMKPITGAGGVSACPKDAVNGVKEVVNYICNRKAGGGAVREFVDWLVILDNEKNLTIIKGYSSEAYIFAKSFLEEHRADGSYKLSDGTIANVMTYVTKPSPLTCYESHRKYIDVQYIIYGEEMMLVENIGNMTDSVYKKYDEEKDYTLYNYQLGEAKILKAGDVIVLKPSDGHRGAMAIGNPAPIRKIVFKVPVQNKLVNSNSCNK